MFDDGLIKHLAVTKAHGRKPRKKKEWAPVLGAYERYAALRRAAR